MTTNNPIFELLDHFPADASVKRWPKSKSAGSVRYIAEPNEALSLWLAKVNKVLSKQLNNWPDFMHGGIKGRSYVSYARQHVGKPCVITIDIKKCFDSIKEADVASAIERHLSLPPEVAQQLAHCLCNRGRIAQGFATSNFICNLYLLEPLAKLHHSLKKQGLWLGSYVDDIAISGPLKDPAEVVNQAAITLSKIRLQIGKDKSKIRIMPAYKRQVVCGLLVNKKLSLSKDLKKELFRKINSGEMSSETAKGWIANLKTVDAKFRQKLLEYSVKKGLVS